MKRGPSPSGPSHPASASPVISHLAVGTVIGDLQRLPRQHIVRLRFPGPSWAKSSVVYTDTPAVPKGSRNW
jgi:hypothetical protein